MRNFAPAVALALLHLPGAQLQAQRHDVEVTAPDGTALKATYFSAGKPGPGVVLLHMCDDSRRSDWETLGPMLAARGVHAIAMDYRGHGESGGTRDSALSFSERRRTTIEVWPGDIDAVFDHFVSRPGVDRFRIGAAGGSCGAGNSVLLARRHPEVKTLVMLAGGETPAREFLPRVPWMPILAVASHDDGDAVASMRRTIGLSAHPESCVKVYATGGHGIALFRVYKELEPMIAGWFVHHLITRPVQHTSPGEAPAGTAGAMQDRAVTAESDAGRRFCP